MGVRGMPAKPGEQPEEEFGTGLSAVGSPKAPHSANRTQRGGAGSVAHGLLRGLRPRQWVKNILVFAAPGAAGALGKLHPTLVTIGVFFLFSAVAGGTYLLNDSLDAEADRAHPTKRNRPIASGQVPVAVAVVVGIGLLVASSIGAWLLAGMGLTLVIAAYAVITLSYSAFLKHEPIVDLAAVAAGFVLRAVAGGVATHVYISDWFLIVTSFTSLFMVTGKRYAEFRDLGKGRMAHRPSLGGYTLGYLRSIRTASASVSLTAYCLWAFERSQQVPSGAVMFELSIIPFVLSILRYGLLVDQGQGGAPEEIVLGDRRLQVLGMIWALTFALGVYL